MNRGISEEEKARLYVELWKQAIAVQMHFNDIELRIRGLALTVLTFILGGASLALRDGTTVRLHGLDIQFGALVLVLGVLLWLAFYFVDQVWYHRLLMGAVIHGETLEKELRRELPHAGLTMQITESSPYTFKVRGTKGRFLWKKEIHSSGKIRFFYWFIAGLLIIIAIFLQLTLQPKASQQTTKSASMVSHVPCCQSKAAADSGLSSGNRDLRI